MVMFGSAMKEDIQEEMEKAYRNQNRLAAEAAKLEKERNQLKKELYDLRKAVWSLDLSDKYELEKALENNEMLGCTRPVEIWAEIDRLMGDWSPEKDIGENNSGDNPAEKMSIPKPSNVPHVSPAGKIRKEKPKKLFSWGQPPFEKTDWPSED